MTPESLRQVIGKEVIKLGFSRRKTLMVQKLIMWAYNLGLQTREGVKI